MRPHVGFGIVFLFFVGLWIDQISHTGYVFAFAGVGIGILYLIYEIWKMTRGN